VLCAPPGVLAHVLVGQSKGACCQGWQPAAWSILSALLTCCGFTHHTTLEQLPHRCACLPALLPVAVDTGLCFVLHAVPGATQHKMRLQQQRPGASQDSAWWPPSEPLSGCRQGCKHTKVCGGSSTWWGVGAQWHCCEQPASCIMIEVHSVWCCWCPQLQHPAVCVGQQTADLHLLLLLCDCRQCFCCLLTTSLKIGGLSSWQCQSSSWAACRGCSWLRCFVSGKLQGHLC
jgi:hypothetical protein